MSKKKLIKRKEKRKCFPVEAVAASTSCHILSFGDILHAPFLTSVALV